MNAAWKLIALLLTVLAIGGCCLPDCGRGPCAGNVGEGRCAVEAPRGAEAMAALEADAGPFGAEAGLRA